MKQTRNEFNNMMARRRAITILVSGLLLTGLFCGWSRQDASNDESYKKALDISIRQHAYNNSAAIDEASAQCIGR